MKQIDHQNYGELAYHLTQVTHIKKATIISDGSFKMEPKITFC